MLAKNIHKAPFNLESGVCESGDIAEFTDREFMFLAGMGRAEIAIEEREEQPRAPGPDSVAPTLTPAQKGAATKAANKAAQDAATPPDFS